MLQQEAYYPFCIKSVLQIELTRKQRKNEAGSSDIAIDRFMLMYDGYQGRPCCFSNNMRRNVSLSRVLRIHKVTSL